MPQEKSQPESAFLGPHLWKKSITANQLSDAGEKEVNNRSKDVSITETSGMNIEDFLSEDNFDLVPNISPTMKEDIFEEELRGSRRSAAPTTIRMNDYRLV